jgi:hypothetical protein
MKISQISQGTRSEVRNLTQKGWVVQKQVFSLSWHLKSIGHVGLKLKEVMPI